MNFSSVSFCGCVPGRFWWNSRSTGHTSEHVWAAQEGKENVDIAVVGGLVSQEKNCGEVEGETVNIPKFFILVLSCFLNSSALLQLMSQPH